MPAAHTQLEPGNSTNVSEEVLNAIARALQLTETEHAYLIGLAKPSGLVRCPVL
jgi:transcriptional regulator with XRE-family HTH domain